MKETSFKKKINKFHNLPIATKIVLILFFIFFVVEVFIHLYPFWFAINNSLKTADEIYESKTSLTQTWSFVNYISVFNDFKIQGGIYFETMLWNSVWITAVYLFVNISSSLLVAYTLARFRFPFQGFLFGVMIFTQTIPIIGTGAAAWKLKYALNMINNPSTIWISWAMGFDYSAFILYGTFKGISKSYTESAKIDGANNFTIFFRIIMPMAFPSVVALLVTNFVGVWNNFEISQIVLNKYPNLAYGLYVFQMPATWSSVGENVFYTALVVTILPGLILYLSLQKVIVKNLAVGGLKG